MATVHQETAFPAGRAAECTMGAFGLLVAAVIAYISLDLLLDGMLSRGLAGAVGGPSPAPDMPGPRLVPEAHGAA